MATIPWTRVLAWINNNNKKANRDPNILPSLRSACKSTWELEPLLPTCFSPWWGTVQTVRPQSTLSSLNYSCQVFYQRKKTESHIKNNCSTYLNFSLSSSIDGKGTYVRAFISTHTLYVCYSRATLLCLLLIFMIGRNNVQRTVSEESLLLAISYMTPSWCPR